MLVLFCMWVIFIEIYRVSDFRVSLERKLSIRLCFSNIFRKELYICIVFFLVLVGLGKNVKKLVSLVFRRFSFVIVDVF